MPIQRCKHESCGSFAGSDGYCKKHRKYKKELTEHRVETIKIVNRDSTLKQFFVSRYMYGCEKPNISAFNFIKPSEWIFFTIMAIDIKDAASKISKLKYLNNHRVINRHELQITSEKTAMMTQFEMSYSYFFTFIEEI